MKTVLIIFFIFISLSSRSQTLSEAYPEHVHKGDSLFRVKQYASSLVQYEAAFNSSNGLGKVRDRFKAVICACRINDNEKAFFHLEKIAFNGGFRDQDFLNNEPGFIELHKDPRWNILLEQVKANYRKKNKIPN